MTADVKSITDTKVLSREVRDRNKYLNSMESIRLSRRECNNAALSAKKIFQ